MSDLLLEKKLHRGGVRIFSDRPNFDFFEVTQVHGKTVVEPSNDTKEADGLVVYEESTLTQPLAIKTADCLPIILIGDKGVAHLHAGWRGLHQEIHNHQAVQDIAPRFAYIGPAIQWDSYEVGSEFIEHFPGLQNCFKEAEDPNKFFFNLPQAAVELIKKSYPAITIENCAIDTFTTPGHNSYRRDKTTQRNYTVYYPEHLYRV